MRQIAEVPTPIEGLRRLMIHETDAGGYLFGFFTVGDASAAYDEWYVSAKHARESALDRYNVKFSDWTEIDDVLPGCVQDWIRPMRLTRDANGKPLRGQIEPAG